VTPERKREQDDESVDVSIIQLSFIPPGRPVENSAAYMK